MAVMQIAATNINESLPNLGAENGQPPFLNHASKEFDFSWWLLNSLASFSLWAMLSSLSGREGASVGEQPLSTEIKEDGGALNLISKEDILLSKISLSDAHGGLEWVAYCSPPNLISEKINLKQRDLGEESLWARLLGMINAFNLQNFPSAKIFLGEQENGEDLFLLSQSGAEIGERTPEKIGSQAIFSLDPVRDQGKLRADQGAEKLAYLLREESGPINFSINDDRLFKLTAENSLEFGLPKNLTQEIEISTPGKEPAMASRLFLREEIIEAFWGTQEEKRNNQPENKLNLSREQLAQSGPDDLGFNLAMQNEHPSLEEPGGRKSPLLWLKDNKFEQFGQGGKEIFASVMERREQDLNNLSASEKNFTCAFLKGEKKGALKLGTFSSLFPEVSNQGSTLSPNNLSLMEEIARQVNISSWRPMEAEIYKQISQRIIWSIQNDYERIKVTLDPPQLGNIYLEITREKENIRAKIVTETPLTKELIEHNYWPIQRIIEREGFRLERFDVFSLMDMEWGREEGGEHFGQNSRGKVFPAVSEINEALFLEDIPLLENNKGCLNILI